MSEQALHRAGAAHQALPPSSPADAATGQQHRSPGTDTNDRSRARWTQVRTYLDADGTQRVETMKVDRPTIDREQAALDTQAAEDTQRRELLDRTLDDLDSQGAVEEALPLHDLNTREGIAQVSDTIRAAHHHADNTADELDLDALSRLLDDLSLRAEIDAEAGHGRGEGVAHAVDIVRDALDLQNRTDTRTRPLRDHGIHDTSIDDTTIDGGGLRDHADAQAQRNTAIAPGIAASADPVTLDDDLAGDGAAAAEQSVPGYDEALAALSPNSPVLQQISDQYEHLYDTWDDQAGPMPSWDNYFVTVYEELRGLGLLTGDDAHLNTNTIDPDTGQPFTRSTQGTGEESVMGNAEGTTVDVATDTDSNSAPATDAQDTAAVEPAAKPPADAAAWLTRQAEVHDLIAHRARELGDGAGAVEAEVLACRARLDAAEVTPRGRGHTTPPPERAVDDAAAPAAHAASADREPDAASRE